jgi:hypothetical protein
MRTTMMMMMRMMTEFMLTEPLRVGIAGNPLISFRRVCCFL